MQLLKQSLENLDPDQGFASPKRVYRTLARPNFVLFSLWILSLVLLFQANVTITTNAFIPTPQAFSRDYQPTRFAGDGVQGIVVGVLKQNWLSPSIFELHSDDCLLSFSVNGVEVPLKPEQRCSYPWGLALDLGKYLRQGRNTFKAVIGNDGGMAGFSIHSSAKDYINLSLRVISSLLLLALLVVSLTGKRLILPISLAFALGVAVRFYLTLSTPYWVRTYDYWSHIDYVTHLATNWTLPLAAEGWMFYHPPLYYILNSALVKGLLALSFNGQELFYSMQFFSFALSSIALLYVCKIALELFSNSRQIACFAFLAALWPGVALFAPRINNDLLAHSLGTLLLISLYKFWTNPSVRRLFYNSCLMAACLLAKTSTLPLVAFGFMVVLFRAKNMPFKMVFGSMLSVAVLLAPYLASRMEIDRGVMLGGNIENLDQGLQVETSLRKLFALNPIELLRRPFNDSRSEFARRDYFVEYWLKSSIFGEFKGGGWLGLLAGTLNLSLLLILGMSFWNFFREKTNLSTADGFMLLLALVGSASHFIYRLLVPYSCAQDFRYTWFLILPIAYFLVRGIGQNYKSRISQGAVVLFCCLSLSFLILAPLFPHKMWG